MKTFAALAAAATLAVFSLGAEAGPRVSVGVQVGPVVAGYGGGWRGHGYGYGYGRGYRHWNGGVGLGLVLVAPPLLLSQPVYAEPVVVSAPLPAQPSRPEPVIYPRTGQSAQQTEFDRQDCNRWAVTQPAALADAGVFQRAVEACMDGRGYSVR